MKEYIEREALEKDFNSRLNDLVAEYGQYDHYVRGFDEAVDRLEDAPAADVAEVRHAKWVSLTPPLLLEEFREMGADIFFMCSECKDECKLVEQDDYYNYCPRCGCKMDKEE